jgi:hypothetical protein
VMVFNLPAKLSWRSTKKSRGTSKQKRTKTTYK